MRLHHDKQTEAQMALELLRGAMEKMKSDKGRLALVKEVLILAREHGRTRRISVILSIVCGMVIVLGAGFIYMEGGGSFAVPLSAGGLFVMGAGAAISAGGGVKFSDFVHAIKFSSKKPVENDDGEGAYVDEENPT